MYNIFRTNQINRKKISDLCWLYTRFIKKNQTS